MKTIIAEKPSVARDIAKIVGASQRKDGYLEGNGHHVTWAIGHLVGLAMPKAYGHEKWELSTLPIVPEHFKLEVTNDPGIKKQLATIKELFSKTDEIIVATDAGREGELIFRYIYELTKPPIEPTIKRLWISDMTEKTIRKGLQELKPISDYDRLYHSGKARSESDWLVGINFTQAFTLASKKNKALSIGRVQTATLRLIVDRYNENTTFTSVPFYVPRIKLDHEGVEFQLSGEQKYDRENLALELLTGLKGTQTPPIAVSNKQSSEAPPFLYDLTTLQREANKMYGLTAKKTLDVAQSLYEKHKATTYPRTDSQYLATNQTEDVKEIFNSFPGFSVHGVELKPLVPDCLSNVNGNRVFNDAKISDHHAIIPTTTKVDLGNLGEEERQIYLMIVARFFQSFYLPCIKETRSFKTELRGLGFSATSTVVKEKGWRTLLPDPKESAPKLPDMPTGLQKIVLDSEVFRGQTKPKPIFNESTLLGAMETAGKFVQDRELKESLKEKGLGTSATRAGIIETLIKREYVQRQKKQLIPSEVAIGLIKSLSHLSICSPELTGEVEHKLNLMEKGSFDYSKFIKEMKEYVRSLLPDIIKSGESVSHIKTAEEKKASVDYGQCPKCKQGHIKKGKKAYYCTNWNAETKCDFTVWMTKSDKKLSDSQIKALIGKGKTGKIKGFKSKAGKTFDASLKLDTSFKTVFDFDN